MEKGKRGLGRVVIGEGVGGGIKGNTPPSHPSVVGSILGFGGWFWGGVRVRVFGDFDYRGRMYVPPPFVSV